MTNDAFGGDGMPPPPKALEVDEIQGERAHDGNFSNKNPPGIGGEPSLGADGKSVKHRDNATWDPPPNGAMNVPTTVQELYEQEEKKDSTSTEDMDIEEAPPAEANEEPSAAGDKDDESSLARASKTAGDEAAQQEKRNTKTKVLEEKTNEDNHDKDPDLDEDMAINLAIGVASGGPPSRNGPVTGRGDGGRGGRGPGRGGVTGRSGFLGRGGGRGSASDTPLSTVVEDDDNKEEALPPPFHQTQGSVNADEDDNATEETATIIASEDGIKRREYQMKLSTPKKVNMTTLMNVVKEMMELDPNMEVKVYDASKTGKEEDILSPDEIPESEAARAIYFQKGHDKKHKEGTSIVFRTSTEHSHVKWRQLMDYDVKELKLYIGEHKLASTDTAIIGFFARKNPHMTHPARYEKYIMSRLPMGTPTLTIERIHPKVMGGFQETVKTDVFAVRVCKTDSITVDTELTALLPPNKEGEYYVSFSKLDDELKRKVYQHHNAYMKRVTMVKVSGFNNIDQQHDIGKGNTFSFREFMIEQPSRTTKVPIDVDNGGFKVRGTKIMVLPEYKKQAQELYEEFCELTRKGVSDAFGTKATMDDVNVRKSKSTRNSDQLRAMFEGEDFPDLEETKTSSYATGSNRSGRRESERTARKSSKPAKQTDKKRGLAEQEARRANEPSLARSYSSVASGDETTATGRAMPKTSNATPTEDNPGSLRMHEMVTALYEMGQRNEVFLQIARKEANEHARQVQLLSKHHHAIGEQISLLSGAIATLSRASSNASITSQVSADLAKIKQVYNENPPPPIPREVVTNGAGGAPADASVLSTPATAEVTPDKPDDEEKVEETKPSVPSTPPRNVGSQAQVPNDGFVTPSRKHTADANATPVTQAQIATSNSFSAFSLESLGSTRNRAASSPGKSPSKKKSKRTLTEALNKQVDASLARFNEEEERQKQIHLEEEIERQARQEQEANHLAGLAGFGTDEDAQFDDSMQLDDEDEYNNVTEAEDLWQNANEESDFNMKK
jgi:hypothetical protein